METIKSFENKRIKLPNSQNCFVCGVANKSGLGLIFYEIAPGVVEVNYTVPDKYQGYPGVVHGGIVASLVDEVLGRVHMGSDPMKPRFMYTARLTTRYRKPVPIGKPLRIVGQAKKSKKFTATSTAEIFGPDAELLVEAEALLINIPENMIETEYLENLGWKIYSDQKE